MAVSTQVDLLVAGYESFIRARKNVGDFTSYTFKGYMMNWHHALIAKELDLVYSGETERLMIFTPPRMGKSELVSRRFPAYCFGRNPDTEVIASSYSAELADSFNVSCQRIMAAPQYRELFPNVYTPSTSKFRNRDKFKQTRSEVEIITASPDKRRMGMGVQRGRYKSTGVGGPLTGFGFNLGLIDDPFKNRAEADSIVRRDAIFKWWSSTFLTRAEKNARIVLTMTRWHADDLAGRLLKTGNWKVITLPHIKDSIFREYDKRNDGDLLWPWKFDQKYIDGVKMDGGLQDWASLHQQKPYTEGGNIIKSEWWVSYNHDELPRFFDEIIQSWDFTFKKTKNSDYVCGQVWGYKGSNKYLLDMVRRRMSFVESREAIANLKRKWPDTGRIYIEDKANGPAIIDSLKSKIPSIIPYNPTSSKEARAHSISGQAQAGNLHIPANAHYLDDFLLEWGEFPNGAHDDVVDATTQAIINITNTSVADFSSWVD